MSRLNYSNHQILGDEDNHRSSWDAAWEHSSVHRVDLASCQGQGLGIFSCSEAHLHIEEDGAMR